MHKSLFLTLVLSLCVADFGAFAATARGNARGTAAAGSTVSATPASAPVAARAGARQKVVSNTSASAMAPAAGGNISARAGKKQTVKSAPTASAAAGKPMAARAGATQKVIQTGSKIATAATNTAVPQECQDAFYGCMDSFCMLDNASGGRCQCNDRITELDKALEEILKLDQQTYIMATEGVERIQMGEAAEQIMARAKAAADKVTVEEKKTQNAEITKKKIKQLDLSAWSTSIFDEDDDDVFGEQEISTDVVDTFADKKGDELYKSAAKMCVTMIPDQCKQYGSMVQLVYSQRIKSDCIAYENSLKQQKNASQQKLLTAQKALREAALEEFNDQNKYADLGSCEIAFKQCVQSTGGCGSDFTGCVADNSILNGLYNKTGSSATPATIKLTNSVSISKATYEILESKALMCESVVKQCVNANKSKDVLSGEVFKQFVKDVAPALYSAEYNMASNKRMNCITTIMNCVKTSCKSEGMEQGSTNYEACLSNPDSIKNYCSLEINRCGDTMSQNDVLKYVAAKLAADKVDACTEQIRSCLTSGACGENYLGCVGMSVDQIVALCPIDKLSACQEQFDRSDSGVAKARNYISQVIMGLKLQISNGIADRCQEAMDKAMVKLCGAADSCEKFTLDNVQYDALVAKACTSASDICYDSVDLAPQDDIIKGKILPRLVNRLNLNNIKLNSSGMFEYDTSVTPKVGDGYTTTAPKELINGFNNLLNAKIGELSSDPVVNACINGKDLTGIFPNDASLKSDPNKGKALTGLANGAKTIISNRIQSLFAKKYAEKEAEFEEEKFQDIYIAIANRLNSITDLKAEDFYAAQQIACDERALTINKTDNSAASYGHWRNDTSSGSVSDGECSASGGFCELGSQYFFDTWWGRNERRMALYWTKANYDRETGVCTLTKTKYPCLDYDPSPEVCKRWDTTGEIESTNKIQLPKFGVENMRN